VTLPADIEDSSEPQGPAVRDLLDAGLLPIGLALEIARQVLEGPAPLALSPGNLRLVRGSEGAPVVQRIDPGIASRTDDPETPSEIQAFGVLLSASR
jgi:hypothetical protein